MSHQTPDDRSDSRSPARRVKSYTGSDRQGGDASACLPTLSRAGDIREFSGGMANVCAQLCKVNIPGNTRFVQAAHTLNVAQGLEVMGGTVCKILGSLITNLCLS